MIDHHSIFDHGTALAVWTTGWTCIKYAFDAAVGSMDAPDATSTRRYRFWFRFLNKIAANLDRARLSERGVDTDATR